MTLNLAQGGSGGSGSAGQGGAGGDGQGGGVFNAEPNVEEGFPGATLSLTNSIVSLNLAIGGAGADGGSSGQGQGGGLYLASGGTTNLVRTLVVLNIASTSDNNIFTG